MLLINGLYTCTRHNYSSSSAVCPHCFNEQQITEFKNSMIANPALRKDTTMDIKEIIEHATGMTIDETLNS